MTTNPKILGAMKHLLNELHKIGIIDHIDKDHLIDRYQRGKIINFGHLAEYLRVIKPLGDHNYDQIIRYGRYYGEN